MGMKHLLRGPPAADAFQGSYCGNIFSRHLKLRSHVHIPLLVRVAVADIDALVETLALGN